MKPRRASRLRSSLNPFSSLTRQPFRPIFAPCKKQYSAFRFLPLPKSWREERHEGSTFQHRLLRTAYCRWPAAPHRAYTATTPGFVVLTIPQPMLGQSGRRKGFRLKFRRCIRFSWGPKTLMAHRTHEKKRVAESRGRLRGSHQQTCSNLPRSISKQLGAPFSIKGTRRVWCGEAGRRSPLGPKKCPRLA
jgi:hypothetical protein